ncbi:metabotropic glutamate receptor 2-like [Amphiura filiformis]|uniref:metabotropic glutamate receptor 2-like n=1 Tax=Amphiura filiformis TaxID=82378 RepID=UPI003B20FBDA
MVYAIETINNRNDILPNVSIGFDIRNNCVKEDLTLWTMMSMTTPGGQLDYQEACPGYEIHHLGKIIGVIGPSTSSTSVFAAKVGGVTQVPVISYIATSDELSDSERFPYFLRTVPPDKFQVGAIVDLLLNFDWKYVALFYSIDTYGIHGARNIQTLAEAHDICIAFTVPVASFPTSTELEDIATKLKEYHKVNAIVIFGSRRSSYAVLKAISTISRHLTVIGGDGIGINMATDGFGPVTHGGIFIRLFNPGEEQTRTYFESLPYKQNTSQWYKDLLQGIALDNECTDWSNCPIPGPHLETLIQNAVYALAYAADSVMRTYCLHGTLCNEIYNGTILLQHLLNVSFQRNDESEFYFDGNGDTAGKYVIRNMQLLDGKYQLVDVGIWDPHNSDARLSLHEHEMQWQPEDQPPRSECVEYCKLGYISIPLKQKCCFGCQRCPAHAFVANGTECIECLQTEWPDKDASRSHDRYSKWVILHETSCVTATFSATMAKAVLNLAVCLSAFLVPISSTIPERACEVHYSPGRVVLGGLFPAYFTDITPCDGKLWGSYISMMEIMIYSIHLINQRDDLLSNISLGYEIRNNCNDEDVSLWSMITMTSPSGNVDYKQACPNYDRGHDGDILGVIGPSTSATSLFVAKAASIYQVPMISYLATSDELSDSHRFPYFLRSVSPDKFQVGAIIDILMYFNWKYIALFYSVDSYGVNGARQLRSIAQNLDICITINLPVPSLPSEADLQDVADKLHENDKINVIVIFALRRPANTVLRAVQEFHSGRKFTFIGSDGWGEPAELQLGGFNGVANGGLFIIIACFSALFAPTKPEYLFPAQRKPYLEVFCKFGYGFLASCVYNLILIIACCYFALRARKVPSNYNESKFIAISVYSTLIVCMAAVPVYSTAVAVLQKVATLCMALLLNAYLTLVCIYLPKLYAIHFAGEDDLTIVTWRTNTVSNSLTNNQVQPVNN